LLWEDSIQDTLLSLVTQAEVTAEARSANHLRLGMTLDAFEHFVNDKFSEQQSGSYERNETNTGPFWDPMNNAVWNTGPHNTYDLCLAAKTFLRANDSTTLSVCEVLINKATAGVGLAGVFFSHSQQVPLEEMLQSMRDALLMYPHILNKDTRFFIDAVSLRQCQKDFDLDSIRNAIQSMPFTLIELDAARRRHDGCLEPAYLFRKFCIFECFATIMKEDGCLLVCGSAVKDRERAVEWVAKVTEHHHVLFDSSKAICRYLDEAVKIDSLIEDHGRQLLAQTRAEGRPTLQSYGFNIAEESYGHANVDAKVSAAIAAAVIKGMRLMNSRDPSTANAAAKMNLASNQLTDRHLQAYCHDHCHPKMVKNLSIERCSKVTQIPEGLGTFTNLCRLDCRDCTALENIASLSALANLRFIDFAGCHVLSDIHSLARLYHLESIDFGFCVTLHDISPLTDLNKLQSVSFYGCRALSGASSLVGLLSLQLIDFRDCPQISQEQKDGLSGAIDGLRFARTGEGPVLAVVQQRKDMNFALS
jgi:hypothetical protein